MKAKFSLSWLLVISIVLGGIACVPDTPPPVRLAPETRVPEKMGLVIWVDGLDIDVFNSLQKTNRLPNITKYLINRGVTVKSSVASLPTITYANDVSFVTGVFPGHHGIIANKWFDRYSLIFYDYGFIKTYRDVDFDFTYPTIYELLHDEYTATILVPVRRGATRNIDNWASAGISWYFGLQKNINHLTTVRFELISDVANLTGRWPKFILAYYVTPDTIGHMHGTTDGHYADMIIDVDKQVGNICQALEKANLLEKTYITLVSDHGFVNTPNHFDVVSYFRKNLGIETISKMFGKDVPFERRVRHFAKARAVIIVSGKRFCSIHLRAGKHWWERPTLREINNFVQKFGTIRDKDKTTIDKIPLPESLAAQEAVEMLVIRAGDNSIILGNKTGLGKIDRITRDGEKLYRYGVIKGSDPLGYSTVAQAAVLMDGRYHDAETWLKASINTAHPDCVVQLIELSDSPRSGDIMLFARDGWDFDSSSHPSNRGGHGGILRHEIIVPWIWAGPGIPAGKTIAVARTVDLMPTMLDLLGRAGFLKDRLDGTSIADKLKHADELSNSRKVHKIRTYATKK